MRWTSVAEENPFAAGDGVVMTDAGLYCPAAGAHIDPWCGVERAITTHAHADHVGFGSAKYLTSRSGKTVLRSRVTEGEVEALPWGERVRVGDAWVSLHPAGHVLGSAQVRIESAGGEAFPTVVVTGDYQPGGGSAEGGVAEAFEAVACDLFVTESTFGLPIFRWPDPAGVAAEINVWWRGNAERGLTSVVFAYSLGKAQRVLSVLDASIGVIGLHGSALRPTEAYRAEGVRLPAAVHANAETAERIRGTGLVIAPGSTDGSAWLRKFRSKEGMRTAYASGWMRVRGKRRWRAADRGFVLSDHADWDGLLSAVKASGAERVGVTHGYTGALARYLNETGEVEAFTVATRFSGEALDEGDVDGEGEGEG